MSVRLILTTAVLATLASPILAQTWTQVTPVPSPSTRRDGGMAYDLVNGNVLLYGGLLSPTAINNETWSFDGTNWTQLTPATTPPARWGHRMVFDSRRARIVTFGGRSPTTTATANDTWEWNGVDWQQVITPVSPSARAFYSMAYDERRGKVIIFGAQTNPPGSQLWEYDGTTWAQVTLANAPLGRDQPVLVYDRARGVTVLFGGWNASSPGTMHNDTWEYDGNSWTQRTTANSPAGRYRTAHWYDDARGRVVVYGGYGSTTYTDTWEYDGSDWTQVATTGPARNAQPFAAYDQARRQAYHFGGASAAGPSQETWIYTGPQTAIFGPFGQGCAGSGGMPVLAANAPVLGQTFTLTVSNLGVNTVGTALIQGFSSTTLGGGIYLPLNLAAYGIPGCQLEIVPSQTLFLFAVSGTATFSFTVPNIAGLLNLPYFTQALAPDFGAANGQASMSNAGHAVLGN